MIDTSLYPKEVAYKLDLAIAAKYTLGHNFPTNSKYITASYKDRRVYVLGSYDADTSYVNWILYLQPQFGSQDIIKKIDDCVLYEDPFVDQLSNLEEDLID